MNVPIPRIAAVIVMAASLMLASCGGGGGGGGKSGDLTATDLVLIDVSVADLDGVPLNEWIDFEFSEELDPNSVRPDTIQIREGPNYGKQVPGFFRVGIVEEGKNGRFVRFYPRLPTVDTLADGGLQPGTPYRITLPGAPKVETVRNYTGDRLVNETSVNFQTALAGSKDLFTDNFLDEYIPGISPGVTFVNPPDGALDVSSDVQIVATFTRRPLNPATVNATNITLTMVSRMDKLTGQIRVWNRPIPGIPVLEQGFDRVTVTFVPRFPLSDEALYRLHIDRRVQDLVGNDVAPLDTEFTIIDEPFKESALTLNFTANEKVSPLNFMDKDETTASWDEAIESCLVALFTVAGGMGTSGDLTPTANETHTPTNTPGVEIGVYEDGVFYDVFNFRKIDIPQGVTVRFQGNYTSSRRGLTDSNNHALKIMALFPINIEGVLNVSGGNGDNAETNTSNSALPYGYGGIAGPGGGHGANCYTGASPNVGSSVPAMDGVSPSNGSDGGDGGYFDSGAQASYMYAGGGGGGAGARTPGLPGEKGGFSSTGYFGLGGLGGQALGGNLERSPHYGGAGGGAGTMAYVWTSWQQYRNAGAGGGGGGGAVTLQSGASITVSSTGKIMSDGGTGGDCATTFYLYYGGAGGGGSGGSVKLRSTTGITLEPGATISVAGGAGGAFKGTYSWYAGGRGGRGGDGWIRMESPNPKDEIKGINTAQLTYSTPSVGTFFPIGGGAPSIGQTNWLNLGVFDPEMLEWKPLEDKSDYLGTGGDTITYYVQMADEDTAEPGTPDLSAMDLSDADGDGATDDPKAGMTDIMSEWVEVSNIRSLNSNGYQFIRIRIVFQLDNKQEFTDVLPYVDWFRVSFRY